MIIKQRKRTSEMDGLIALERRLGRGNENKQKIKEKLYNVEAGYNGECQYDKYLKEFKPRYPHAILHDVTLNYDGIYFQMDSLLITSSFIVISEVKNIAEKIVVKAKPMQFIKEYPSGQRIPLRSPITEVERKIHLLENWLHARNIKMPVRGLIAFAYNNEMQIEETPEMDIMFTYDVPAYLRSLPINQEILSRQEIQKLSNEILKNHREFNPFPLATKFNIHPAEIIPGVICTECGKFKMKWEERKWRCFSCGYMGSEEYKAALEDWRYLIKETMTNKEFRYFMQIECRHLAKYLLAKAPTKLIGHGRNAHYELQIDK
ncbi:nuclease-related domain-containing protein [Sporosarcina sp. FSL W8-0480]|uniref:nuclease-related domain-containing protein n=1 Tax=Sporosarcina sp. FSL W8-0480 TaxID=2954701 RepID=UPI0030D727A9